MHARAGRLLIVPAIVAGILSLSGCVSVGVRGGSDPECGGIEVYVECPITRFASKQRLARLATFSATSPPVTPIAELPYPGGVGARAAITTMSSPVTASEISAAGLPESYVDTIERGTFRMRFATPRLRTTRFARRLSRGPMVMRVESSSVDEDGSLTASELTLVRLRGVDAGLACLRMALTQPADDGALGTVTLVGGTGAAASMLASGPLLVLTVTDHRLLATSHPVKQAGEPLPLPPECVELETLLAQP